MVRRRVVPVILAFTLRAADATLLVRRSGDNDLWEPPSFSFEECEISPESSLAYFDQIAENITLTSKLGRNATFPRGRWDWWPPRSYVGMHMWNSRGDMNVRRAVAAMLGDPHAFYESPMFTAFKLLSLGKVHELSQRIRPSTSDTGYPEEYTAANGYNDLYSQITWRAFDLHAMSRFPQAETEEEAIEVARHLMDDMFVDLHAYYEKVMKWKLPPTTPLNDDPDPFYRLSEPASLVFSMVTWRRAAKLYGDDPAAGGRAALVLYEMARYRGMDGGYFKLRDWIRASQTEPGETKVPPLTQATAADLVKWVYPDMCDCDDPDFTEMFTPGYHVPDHIAGMELRGVAYYKMWHRGAPYVVIMQTEGLCTMQNAAGSRFYRCREPLCTKVAGDDYCNAERLVAKDPLKPVLASGVLYGLPLRDGEVVAAAAAAEAVRRRKDSYDLLKYLNGPETPVPASAMEPGVSNPLEVLLRVQGMQFRDKGGPVRVAGILASTVGTWVEVNPGGTAALEGERPAAADILRKRAGLPPQEAATDKRGDGGEHDLQP